MYNLLCLCSFIRINGGLFVVKELFVVFAYVCNHEFKTVFLVDVGRAWVVIYCHDIGVGIFFLDFTAHTLCDDMVGQTPERLCANYIFCARFGKAAHFGGYKPAFAHFDTLVYELIRLLSELFEIVHGVETAVRHNGFVEFSRQRQQNFIKQGRNTGYGVFESVNFTVVYVVYRTVKHEIHKSGNDGLAPLADKEFFEVVIGKRRIFDVNLPHYSHARFSCGVALYG